jgi:hypothetical protein
MDIKKVLSTATTAFVLAIVLPIIFRALEAASKRDSRRVGSMSFLEYPIAAKALGILAIGVSAVLMFSALNERAGRRTLTIAVCSAMALLFLALPLECFSRRIEFNDQEVVIRSIWHRERRIRWADVISFIHLPREKAWVLESKTYGKIKISSFLQGLNDLRMAAVKYGKAA